MKEISWTIKKKSEYRDKEDIERKLKEEK